MNISALVDELREYEQRLEQREQELAAAMEEISQQEEVQLAFLLGQQEERLRVLRMIDLQLETLARGGLNALSLRTLRDALREEGR
jgi:ABC-type Fe3+-citrate transport system substrate-binding protein